MKENSAHSFTEGYEMSDKDKNIPESPEKPFLIDEDAWTTATEHGYDSGAYSNEELSSFVSGFNAAASKANEKIKELEEDIKEFREDLKIATCKSPELLEAESKLLENERDQFAIEFAEWIRISRYKASCFKASKNWINDYGQVHTIEELLEQFKSTRK